MKESEQVKKKHIIKIKKSNKIEEEEEILSAYFELGSFCCKNNKKINDV